jgi:hypothetical protein
MKRLTTILSLAFAVCLSVVGDEVRTNVPTGQVIHTNDGTRLWISSFAPLTVSTEQREWPAVNCRGTPLIPVDICRQWRTNHAVLRQLLIAAAEKEHLDSTSLAKVLTELDLQKPEAMAVLPVEVQSAEVKGELAWVVGYRWEYGEKPNAMDHIMSEAFARKTLKLIWVNKCD